MFFATTFLLSFPPSLHTRWIFALSKKEKNRIVHHIQTVLWVRLHIHLGIHKKHEKVMGKKYAWPWKKEKKHITKIWCGRRKNVMCVCVCVCAEKERGFMDMDVSTLNFEMRINFVFTAVFVWHLVQKSVDVGPADDAVGFEAAGSAKWFTG